MRQEYPGSIPTCITQAQIENLLVLRQEAEEARTAANKKQAEVDAEEARLMEALNTGVKVEAGAYMLVITTEPMARSVKWRTIVQQNLGRAFVEQVLAATPPGERQVLKVLQEIVTDGGRR